MQGIVVVWVQIPPTVAHVEVAIEGMISKYYYLLLCESNYCSQCF